MAKQVSDFLTKRLLEWGITSIYTVSPEIKMKVGPTSDEEMENIIRASKLIRLQNFSWKKQIILKYPL